MAFSGQHGQEGLNFSTTHPSRMPKSAPLNEDPGPLHTGLPGAQAIVLALNTLTHLIQYARGAQHGKGGGLMKMMKKMGGMKGMPGMGGGGMPKF